MEDGGEVSEHFGLYAYRRSRSSSQMLCLQLCIIFLLKAAHHQAWIQTVQGPGERRIWRGNRWYLFIYNISALCLFLYIFFSPGVGLSGPSHWDDVRLQKAGEDSHKEEERRSHGAQWETDTGRAEQPVCGEEHTNDHGTNSSATTNARRLFFYLIPMMSPHFLALTH